MSEEALVEPVEPVGDPAPTVLEPVVTDPTPQEPVDYFSTAPEDWRSQMLSKAGFEEGEDFDKAMKQLERVSDFGVLAKNYLSAQDKIRSGEISTGLPDDPTDEQLADYREAHGIPQTPEEYSLTLRDGLELDVADKETMDKLQAIAHSNNMPDSAMNEIANALLEDRANGESLIESQDGVDKQMADQLLKEAWGGDYTTNINMVKGLVNQLPESIKESFENARLADGKGLLNSAEVMVAMAEWARKINPAATVVPNSSNPMQTMNDEINKLEDQMGTPEWYKDKDAQNRYQKLIEAREQMKG